MKRRDLCGELFPEGALTGFIRYPGRYVKNIACKKCTEEHSVPKWMRGAPMQEGVEGARGG